MTYAPAALSELMTYWVRQGGANLGIVGDLAHQRRASYHNGQDAITKYGRTAANDYSIRLERDREPHLTSAAAGIDLGALNGDLRQLYAFSKWLVQQCINRAPGTEDIREVIYSPDGKIVQRWDNHDRALRTGWPVTTGQGDQSHLWHTHISWFRDSERRSKVGVFSPYFEDEEVAIDYYPIPRPTGTLTIKEGRGLVNLITGKASMTTDLTKTSLGGIHLVEPWSDEPGMQEGYLVRHKQQAWVALDGVVETPPETPVAGDCSSAVAAERSRAESIRDDAVAKLAEI